MSLGGEHLWNKIVENIAIEHGYKKSDYKKVANEPMPEDFCECDIEEECEEDNEVIDKLEEQI